MKVRSNRSSDFQLKTQWLVYLELHQRWIFWCSQPSLKYWYCGTHSISGGTFTKAKYGSLWLDILFDNEDTITSPPQNNIFWFTPFYSTLLIHRMTFLAYLVMDSFLLSCFIYVGYLFDEGAETLPNISTGNTHSVSSLNIFPWKIKVSLSLLRQVFCPSGFTSMIFKTSPTLIFIHFLFSTSYIILKGVLGPRIWRK